MTDDGRGPLGLVPGYVLTVIGRIVRSRSGISRLGVLVGALLLVVSTATAARAHGDSGIMSIDATSVGVSTGAGDPAELTVQVRITHADDGDAAVGAVATATATEAGGAVASPVTLADAGDGSYTGELLLPAHGTWTVRVESTNPVAAAEQTVDVVATSTPTSPQTSTISTTLARRKESTSSKTSDDTTTVVLVAIAAVVVAAGLTAWLIARSRSRGTGGPST